MFVLVFSQMTESAEEPKTPKEDTPVEVSDVDLKEKIKTLEQTIDEREKQLKVSAMQNARLMDLLSKAQGSVVFTDHSLSLMK